MESNPDFPIEMGYKTNKTSFESKLELELKSLFRNMSKSRSNMVPIWNHPVYNPRVKVKDFLLKWKTYRVIMGKASPKPSPL